MVQARWALSLALLLAALPARAAAWRAHAGDPEYQDGRGQSSVETSKVLREILRELKVILGGVKSLSLSRRSASGGAEPDAAGPEAEPGAALARADTDAVDANSFQQYCIEGIVAVLGSMVLGMVLCCVLHVWRKRRKRLAGA